MTVMPTTTIEVNRLSVYAYHGVDPQERLVGNDYEVSVSVDYPCQKAMVDDSLDDTINYAEMMDVIVSEMARPSKLLEHVCYRIQQVLMQRYPAIQGGMVTVRKLHPPVKHQLESAAVTYRW